MGADLVLPGDRVNDLVAAVVNHLHPVDGLLGVHEVVLIPFLLFFDFCLHLVLI